MVIRDFHGRGLRPKSIATALFGWLRAHFDSMVGIDGFSHTHETNGCDWTGRFLVLLSVFCCVFFWFFFFFLLVLKMFFLCFGDFFLFFFPGFSGLKLILIHWNSALLFSRSFDFLIFLNFFLSVWFFWRVSRMVFRKETRWDFFF